MTVSVDEAATIISEAAADDCLVVLVGAGASMWPPASLPSWYQLANTLADRLEGSDISRSEFIRSLAQKKTASALLEALDAWERSSLTKKQKQDFIRKLFDKTYAKPPEPYRVLVQLPARHVLTTNYDQCLDVANQVSGASRQTMSPREIESVVSLWYEKSFGLYLHGRGYDRQSMVLTSDDYRRVREDPHYRELLSRMFLHSTVLAYGFSFSDPNFIEILRFVSEDLSGATRKNHVAILPQGEARNDDLLQAANVCVLEYEIGLGDHKNSLRILKQVASRLGPRGKTTSKSFRSSSEAQDFATLSAVFLSIATPDANYTYPIACATFLLQALGGRQSAKKTALVGRVAQQSHADFDTAKRMVEDGVSYLESNQVLEANGNQVRLAKAPKRYDLGNRLRPLIRSIVKRAETYDANFSSGKEDVRRMIRDVLSYVMLAQGASVARALCNHDDPSAHALPLLVAEALDHLDVPTSKRDALQSSLVSMLSESSEYGDTLFRIAHAAYSLETVFLNPVSADFGQSMKWELYLDSNVVLRVLYPTDTRSRMFRDVLTRLRRLGTPLRVLYPFVTEVVDHSREEGRHLARAGIRDVRGLRRYVADMPKSARSPVLVAYLLRCQKGYVRYEDFLRDEGLNRHAGVEQKLAEEGVGVEGRESRSELDSGDREALWHELKLWRGSQSLHERALRRNEATQIFWLMRLREQGARAWFFSVDNELRRALKHVLNGRYAGYVTTPSAWAHRLSSVQWATIDFSGYSDLIWTLPEPTPVERVRYSLVRRICDDPRRPQSISADRIRDAVEDFIERGPLVAAVQSEYGAAKNVDSEFDGVLDEMLPDSVDQILEGLSRDEE